LKLFLAFSLYSLRRQLLAQGGYLVITPRFGIWVPVYGPWGTRHHPQEPPQPSYARALDIVVQAERLNFADALLAQHMINPMNNDFDQLETWSALTALAQATRHIEIMGAVKPFFIGSDPIRQIKEQAEQQWASGRRLTPAV